MKTRKGLAAVAVFAFLWMGVPSFGATGPNPNPTASSIPVDILAHGGHGGGGFHGGHGGGGFHGGHGGGFHGGHGGWGHGGGWGGGWGGCYWDPYYGYICY